jgi:predicted HicB family RNase H-like nuclease
LEALKMKYKGYTGASKYSVEDGCYHGQIAFIHDLITYDGESLEELETAFREAVDRYLEHCEETGSPANTPARDSDKLKNNRITMTASKEMGLQSQRSMESETEKAVVCDLIGKRIGHRQARKIAQRILEQAEQRRMDFADLEASEGIQYGD